VTALLLAAGLLTKAYFLALAPLALEVTARRGGMRQAAWQTALAALIAGPWYLRNVLLYGTLSGTQESRAGITVVDALRAAPLMNWPAIAYSALHSAFWTANNTFRTFSETTVNLVLIVCLAAFAMWALARPRGAELLAAAYAGVFLLAFGYTAAVASIATHGLSATPCPWHVQVLAAPLLALCLLGASRCPRAGFPAAALLPLLFGYVLAATYIVKLIPLYSGYTGKGALGGMLALYGRHFRDVAEKLDTAALGSMPVIFGLTLAVTIVVAAQLATLIRDLAVHGPTFDAETVNRGALAK
jgi:hypothetical protein